MLVKGYSGFQNIWHRSDTLPAKRSKDSPTRTNFGFQVQFWLTVAQTILNVNVLFRPAIVQVAVGSSELPHVASSQLRRIQEKKTMFSGLGSLKELAQLEALSKHGHRGSLIHKVIDGLVTLVPSLSFRRVGNTLSIPQHRTSGT